MQLDLPIRLALDDHGVVKLDDVLLDGVAEIDKDILRRGDIVVGDRNKITHWVSTSGALRLIGWLFDSRNGCPEPSPAPRALAIDRN